jgi:apolipoprotein N-acyltransferase
VRDRRERAGPGDLVIVQSATSTFQNSVAPAQHASLAAVRAADTGRPVLHAPLTGSSAAFDARGRRLAWFDTRHSGVVTISVPLASRRTPFVRYGDWVLAWTFTVLAAAAALASLSHARVVVAPAPPRSSGG